ncbi:MAG: hypothetical protein P8M65_13440 [Roseibacillus sp.]|nr:hypothetical protein [Roseibacillus sp.]
MYRIPCRDGETADRRQVKPAVTLAETCAPNGAPFTLVEHDGEYSLHSGGVQLESSFAHNGAAELGRLSAQPFRSARQPRILVAGLGLGYVLSGLRNALPQKRAVFQVAEPIPELPGWHREHLSSLHEGQLEDSRLIVRKETLNEALRKDKEGWQALVIDADSALPQAGVTSRGGVPHSSFLHRAHSSLKEGGLLAISCSSEHHAFERKIRRAGFDVVHEIVPTSQKGKQKQRSTIWLARKGAYEQSRSYRGAQNK